MTTKAPKSTTPVADSPLNMVTMTDGRIVEFAGKRKLLKTAVVDANGIGVLLDFLNGQTRTFYIPEDLIEKFAVHGAEQKLGDEIAGLEDIEDCVMAVDDLIDRLYNKEWSARREVNALSGASVLAKALVQVGKKTLVEVRTFLSTLSQAQKVALRNNPKIAPIVKELEAAKAAKAKPRKVIDTDTLLDNLSTGVVPTPVSTEPAHEAAPI